MEDIRRITYRPVSPNPLFMQWLQEFRDDAVARDSQSQYSVKEAMKSLRLYPLPLRSGRECAILKGFGKRLCFYLDSKLKSHEEQTNAPTNNVHTPTGNVQAATSNVQAATNNVQAATNNVQVVTNNIQATLPSAPSSSSGTSNNSPRKRAAPRKKSYKPKNRSGACALLLALLDHANSGPSVPFLYKDELMKKAQPLSEESFYRPKPGTHYAAWASMTILTRKGLVKSFRRKKAEYSLTEEGLKLATELYNEYKDIPTTNNLMDTDFGGFHNNLMHDEFRTFGDDQLSPALEERLVYSDEESSAPTTNGSQSSVKPVQMQYENFSSSDSELPIAKPSSLQSQNTGKIPERAKAAEESQSTDEEIVESDDIIEMPAGCFDVVLLIDKQETSGGLHRKTDPTVVQFNKYDNLKHEYRHLKIGDFAWIARSRTTAQELVLPYIVERKRMDDLAGSIKDGRYREQKFRLKRCGLSNVIYLIENYGSNRHVGLPFQTLMQAIENTRVQSGFKVHTTDSLASSVRFLAMMTKRLTIEYEDKTLMGLNKQCSDFLMTFDYINKASAKTKPLTVTETFTRMLLQMKSVSLEKALAITQEYKTPKSLIEKYKLCEPKEGELLLANLRYKEFGTNVGPSVSKSIYQLFTLKVLL